MDNYIECYHANGSQILGNLDGQAVVTANYKLCKAYKRLKNIIGNPKWMDAKVAFAKIVTKDNKVIETITTKHFVFPTTKLTFIDGQWKNLPFNHQSGILIRF